ncbi:hypothetical protein [Megalodesulfovibrio gigas]|uniref:hypothetical protein n=1 Tax=Megalodesulfovibrio gigas TaxID=879 RepID=UPI0011850667|nr:hypothetical protein [Megalodesulfovibrio gigas]
MVHGGHGGNEGHGGHEGQGREPEGARAGQCSIVVKAPAWLCPNQPGMGRPMPPVRKQRSIAGVRVRRFVK